MASNKAHINPEILRWARDKSNLSLEEAAKHAGVSGTKKVSSTERLASWENGDDAPTRKQLNDLAKAYYRPVLTFYMKQPPEQTSRLPDFRTIGDHPVAEGGNVLEAFVRKMRAKQQEIVELITEDMSEIVHLPFIGRFTHNDEPKIIAEDIRQELQFDTSKQQSFRDRDALFRALRTKAEEIGIFVLLQGNLGSHHTNIEADEFRGIALADPVAPFIIINNNDANAAYVFTLIHEMAHLWLGETGVSNLSPFSGTQREVNIETLCNQVATEFLMPRELIEEKWGTAEGISLYEKIANIAIQLSISRAATANRLWKLGILSDEQWWALYRTYQSEWRKHRAKQKEKSGGPSYYVTTRSQLGNAIIRTVLGAVDAGSLTYTRASRILGVNAKSFDGLRARAS